MNKVLILGATSPTAQAFIKLMTTEHPEISLRLFVRNINKLPMEQRHTFDVIIGDGKNYDDYVRSLKDVNYIYDSIGGLGTEGFTELLIKAIENTSADIKHIVDISAGGIYGEHDSGNEQRLSAVQTMYPEYTKDQRKKLTVLQQSGLHFTIFRPGLIKNGPETSIITHTPDFKDIGKNLFNINRSTFARACMNALLTNQYDDQSLSISNGSPK